MSPPRQLFVIGASGAGKTTAVTALERRGLPSVRCYYFDSIGVPTAEEMKRQWGGGDGWQADATQRWIERLSANTDEATLAVLDGQTRPSFIRPHLDSSGIPYRILLFDCSTEIRAQRLRDGRGQPELASSRMEHWAAYLRREAEALGLPVVDTSQLSVAAATDRLQQEVETLQSQHFEAVRRC